MSFHLVPADFSWLSDVRLRETLVGNFRDKIEESVRDLAGSRQFAKVPQNVKVTDLGNAVLVEVSDRETAALEKGVQPHQMRHLEGSVVPIQTPAGTIFRKATSLSMMLGKWRRKASSPQEPVKRSIERAMEGSAETVVKTKEDLQAGNPPRIKDILGVR